MNSQTDTESPLVEEGQPVTETKPTRIPVILRNPLGLHMRPAAAFAKAAGRYQSSIMVYKGNRAANGKSFTNLLMLAAGPGSELVLEVEGPDACEACRVLAELLSSPSPDGHEVSGH